MIYGRSVVGGYGTFMKLRPKKGLLNIYGGRLLGLLLLGSSKRAGKKEELRKEGLGRVG